MYFQTPGQDLDLQGKFTPDVYKRQALFDHSLEHMVKLSEKDLSRSVAIFNEMYDCFTDESNPDRQTLLYMKLVEFMMLFYRAQTSTPVRAQSGAPGADGAVYDALRHIHQFFNTELSLSSVAKTVGMAPSSLREQLLAYTGQEFQLCIRDRPCSGLSFPGGALHSLK